MNPAPEMGPEIGTWVMSFMVRVCGGAKDGEDRSTLEGDNTLPQLPVDLFGSKGMATLASTSPASVRSHPWLAASGL